jgi:hypothetical protein
MHSNNHWSLAQFTARMFFVPTQKFSLLIFRTYRRCVQNSDRRTHREDADTPCAVSSPCGLKPRNGSRRPQEAPQLCKQGCDDGRGRWRAAAEILDRQNSSFPQSREPGLHEGSRTPAFAGATSARIPQQPAEMQNGSFLQRSWSRLLPSVRSEHSGPNLSGLRWSETALIDRSSGSTFFDRSKNYRFEGSCPPARLHSLRQACR